MFYKSDEVKTTKEVKERKLQPKSTISSEKKNDDRTAQFYLFKGEGLKPIKRRKRKKERNNSDADDDEDSLQTNPKSKEDLVVAGLSLTGVKNDD